MNNFTLRAIENLKGIKFTIRDCCLDLGTTAIASDSPACKKEADKLREIFFALDRIIQNGELKLPINANKQENKK